MPLITQGLQEDSKLSVQNFAHAGTCFHQDTQRTGGVPSDSGGRLEPKGRSQLHGDDGRQRP